MRDMFFVILPSILELRAAIVEMRTPNEVVPKSVFFTQPLLLGNRR